MSEKISMEALLPIALELYKKVPPMAYAMKATSEDEQNKCLKHEAENFTMFYTHLQKKLTESDE